MQGPVSTGVGDRLGIPSGAVSFSLGLGLMSQGLVGSGKGEGRKNRRRCGDANNNNRDRAQTAVTFTRARIHCFRAPFALVTRLQGTPHRIIPNSIATLGYTHHCRHVLGARRQMSRGVANSFRCIIRSSCRQGCSCRALRARHVSFKNDIL